MNQGSSHVATHSLTSLVRAEQVEFYIQMKLRQQVEIGRKYQTGSLAGTCSIRTTALDYLITRTVILELQMKDQVLYFLTPFRRLSSDSPGDWKIRTCWVISVLKERFVYLYFQFHDVLITLSVGSMWTNEISGLVKRCWKLRKRLK